MNQEIHPVVTVGASFVDGGYLTDHGPNHIRTVISRLTSLLYSSPGYSSSVQFPSGYELYILLVAIHVHDVGNTDGRDGHELAAADVMERLGPLFGPDEVEKRLIFRIAQAHSGWRGTSQDKISFLQKIDYVLGKKIQTRFLAALLRFADELADDRSRTARALLDSVKLPKSSEVYHRYAYALHSVVISEDSVRLEFEMTNADATRTFGKGKDEVFLLDEIILRMIKMHRERVYCMRFLRPLISIDRIDVCINIYGPGYNDPLATIDFRMEEAGYPISPSRGILDLCPQLASHLCGSPLTGESLKNYLDGKGQ